MILCHGFPVSEESAPARSRPTIRPIAHWVIWAGIPLMVIIAAAAIWSLLDVGRDQLDAIRTGGTLGVGLGGAVLLWLAIRRQRSTELDLLQKYEAHELAQRVADHNEALAAANRAHQEQVAQDNRDDAAARRITDLYGRAVDQLGSDKAPVRLGGLYALERLAQENPRFRQTIINVLCAYLRMPYSEPTPRTARPLNRRRPPQPAKPPGGDAAQQEREVRLTAQRILETHLNPGADGQEQPLDTFWPDAALDLNGATLIDLDLSGCHIHTARFTSARFTGTAQFDNTKFFDRADFARTEFGGDVSFTEVEFHGHGEFSRAKFLRRTSFKKAQFSATAGFTRAQFDRNAEFREFSVSGWAAFTDARFGADTSFGSSRFGGTAEFHDVHFGGTAAFYSVKFAENAWFYGSSFAGNADFHGAEFGDKASFYDVRVGGEADFQNTTFHGHAAFSDSEFRGTAKFRKARFDGTVVLFSHVRFGGEVQVQHAAFKDEWPAELDQFRA
jgi:uncharacterized protein YjbI with pentapeptide repeats